MKRRDLGSAHQVPRDMKPCPWINSSEVSKKRTVFVFKGCLTFIYEDTTPHFILE